MHNSGSVNDLGLTYGGVSTIIASVYFGTRVRAVSMEVCVHSLSGFKRNNWN